MRHAHRGVNNGKTVADNLVASDYYSIHLWLPLTKPILDGWLKLFRGWQIIFASVDSVFTTPDPSKIIQDPKTFFVEPPVLDDSCLTDINFSKTVIIDAIKELSPNSAAGPDGIPATLQINCASEIAPLLKRIFTSSFSKGYIPPSFKLL